MPPLLTFGNNGMKHVHYQSVGNRVGLENTIDDFWEIGENDYVVRSVHVQADGSHLKYDEAHPADQLGALPEGQITEAMLADRSYGKITLISLSDFEAKWSNPARNGNAEQDGASEGEKAS